jgi:uncharacterized membrane protein HdeD (DUF308 family)
MAMIFDNANNHVPAESYMPAPAERLSRDWAWLLLLATFQILGGVLAVAVPIAASFAAVGVIAALLTVTAFLQIIHAFQIKAWPRSVWYGLGAVLYAAIGAVLILYPTTGALALAVLIAILLIAEGALRTVFGALVRPLPGWSWLVVAGLLSIVVGVILLIGWPVTALWLTGLLLGVNLLMTGIMNAGFAMAARSNTSSTAPAL